MKHLKTYESSKYPKYILTIGEDIWLNYLKLFLNENDEYRLIRLYNSSAHNISFIKIDKSEAYKSLSYQNLKAGDIIKEADTMMEITEFLKMYLDMKKYNL